MLRQRLKVSLNATSMDHFQGYVWFNCADVLKNLHTLIHQLSELAGSGETLHPDDWEALFDNMASCASMLKSMSTYQQSRYKVDSTYKVVMQPNSHTIPKF